MRKSLAVGVALAAIVASSCKPQIREVIVLRMVGGKCTPEAYFKQFEVPERSVATWLVLDACGTAPSAGSEPAKPYDVTLAKFTYKSVKCDWAEADRPVAGPPKAATAGADATPAFPCLTLSTSVDALGFKLVNCAIPEQTASSCWKYSVSVLNGGVLDPEVQVRDVESTRPKS